ncbi:MAG: ComEA family DNA-binding protein [Labilithrix sp.]|nr:ComEA family DNA-binding protein [Labilithrix sp.]
MKRAYRSTWFVIGLRVFAVGVALVTLGWIGRSASADPIPIAPAPSAPAPPAPPAPPSNAIDAGAPVAVTSLPAATAPHASSARATSAEPVFLNQASVDDLRRLPGVGPKRAEAILDLRRRLGRFQRVEDLLRVKGIGRKTVIKWRPLVRLDAPPAADAGAP